MFAFACFQHGLTVLFALTAESYGEFSVLQGSVCSEVTLLPRMK